METTSSKRILLLFYSFSGQTSSLIRNIITALEEEGHSVFKEKLIPCKTLRFPVGSYSACFKMMIATFFRQRVAIEPLSAESKENYDLVILAGPTWSYNPSGPILSLIDRDGKTIFKEKTVLPLISCRGYWKAHLFGLTHLLKKHGAKIPNKIVFSHPSKEPWRTIGVFLKIVGKNPERSAFLGKYYNRFGHSRQQQDEATRLGILLGQALNKDKPLEDINFSTPIALP